MKIYLLFAAFHGFSSVAMGAFGAHALKKRLSEEALGWVETGARYQMYHALALMGAAWLVSKYPASLAGTAGWCFFAGALIFSGSLYAMALGGPRWLGAVTPLGGLGLLAGWGLLAWVAVKAG